MSNNKIDPRTVENFFLNEYLEYAKYTIENRALPSIIDGLKPGARKIMHAAFSTLSYTKEKKFFDVIGAAYSKSKYHHGDSSLESTILTLASQHKDSLAPLEIIGTGGDLRNPGSAAPRYLDLKLSQWAKLFEKDKHILEYNYDGDDKVEPKYYLPLLPLAIAARNTGMAVGYKYSSQVSYNPADLAEQCINVLETGNIKNKLRPYIHGFHGSFTQKGDKIQGIGKWKISPGKITVTELPPTQSYSKYESHLIKLYDDGKIRDWDTSKDSNGNIFYEIKVAKDVLDSQVKTGRFKKIYNLVDNLARPTYTLLNEHGKIAIFNSAEDVLKYFVDFRLSTYDKLKEVNINNIESRIQEISHILKFLNMYFDGKIKLDRNTPIEKTKVQLSKAKIPHSVLDIKITKLTKDEYDKLVNEQQTLENELEVYKNTSTKTLYINELKEMLPEMKKAFPQQEFKLLTIQNKSAA